MGNRIISKSDL